MKTAQEYMDSLRGLKPEIYYQGRRIESVVDDPVIRPHVNAAAQVYQMAHEPEHQSLFSATSPLTGGKVNRFTCIHQNSTDLVNKVRVLRACGQRTGTCFQRCAGWDALHTMYILTHEIDQKHNTPYHERFLGFLRRVQEDDLMVAAGMTDPKGDRSLPPHRQPDPDLFLHIVDFSRSGIVVRGAKAHLTGAVNSHEIVVVPTLALGEEDRDYAVAFAVPVDTKGIFFIFGRQANDTRKEEGGSIDPGNVRYGVVGGEALVVFDDVFVPWERVFMCGEYDMAGRGVEIFAATHRQNYGGCKVGSTDVLIGASSLLAHYQGTKNSGHIRDKLVEMVHLNETLYGCAIAAGLEGSPTPSWAFLTNQLLANTVKQNITRFLYEVCRLAHDIAGGILATLPSEKDYRDPRLGAYIDKYFSTSGEIPTEYRMRVIRLIEAMTGGTVLVEAMHGAGSPQAQRIMMLRQANLDHKEHLARLICGIEKRC